MNLLHWLIEHWRHLIEDFGVLTGLLVAAVSFYRDARVRRIETLFKMNEHHRELWMHFYSRPELAGILDPKRDVLTRPPTGEEVHFVNFLFLHLDRVYRASKAGIAVRPQHIANDIRSFFSLPVPKATWDRLKEYHEGDFVTFVARCLAQARS